VDPPLAVARPPSRVLRLIALFKFGKAVLLMLVGLGAVELLQPDVAARAQRWAEALAASSDRRAVQHLISLVSGLSPRHLQVLGVGAFLYATLFTIEGVGLWQARRWAEYLTVIATLVFVPLEVSELTRGVTAPRLAALTLNLAVAAFLMARLERSRGKRAQEAGA